MICPHCNASLLYKERGRKRCSRCRQKFALEPKQNPLRLHDLRFQKLDIRLSRGGDLFYTGPQLLHQASRKLLDGKKPNYGCGVGLLVGVGFFTFFLIQSEMADPILLIAGAIVLAALIWWFVIMPVTQPAGYLKLPMSSRQFESSILNNWRKTYGVLPEKLLNTEKQQLLPAAQLPPEQVLAVLACPEKAILDCLQANDIPAQLGLALLSTVRSPSSTEQAVLDLLRRRPDMPLLLLHDASVEGVMLSQQILGAFQLNAQQTIFDLGLHPYQALKHNLLRLGAKPDGQALKSLQDLVAGGGALPGREEPFQQVEFDWLNARYYSPLLALTPHRLIKIVVKGVARATTESRPVPASAIPETPEQMAQAVGFMTWPD